MVVSAIILIILFVVGLLVTLVVIGSKARIPEGEKAMIKNVYIYLVLFATLMMTIGGSVGAFMAVADIVAPIPYHQSFEEFKQYGLDKPEFDKKETIEKAKLSDTELRAKYDAIVAAEKNRQIDRAKNSLIKSLGWIVIPLPVFVFFQRRLSSSNN